MIKWNKNYSFLSVGLVSVAGATKLVERSLISKRLLLFCLMNFIISKLSYRLPSCKFTKLPTNCQKVKFSYDQLFKSNMLNIYDDQFLATTILLLATIAVWAV